MASLGLKIAPGIAFLQGIFLGKGVVIHGYRLIISVEGDFHGEEFSVLVCPAPLIFVRHLVHMFLYSGDQLLVFLLGVLPVQDAVLLVSEIHAAETIGTGSRAYAILKMIRLHALGSTPRGIHGVFTVGKTHGMPYFITEFPPSHGRPVIAVLQPSAKIEVLAVLGLFRIPHIVGVLGIHDKISGGIHGFQDESETAGPGIPDGPGLFREFFHLLPGRKGIVPKEGFILFFGHFLVENPVFLASEARASDDVGTVLAIKGEGRILAIEALPGKNCLVAPVAVDILVAQLAFKGPEIVETVLAAELIGIICGILVVMPSYVQIAVLVVCFLVRPIAVYHVCSEQRNVGHGIKEFLKLPEKGFREIILPSVIQGVPVIRPPTGLAVHGIGLVGGNAGDCFLPAHVAFSFIKGAFVPPGDAALLPAFGTEGGFGNFYLFIKISILRKDIKLFFAILTRCFIHVCKRLLS